MAQDRVEAVERALAMLDAFAPDKRALTLTELAQATELYKSTVLRLAGSLQRFGYLGAARGRAVRVGAGGWESSVRPIAPASILLTSSGRNCSFW